MTKKLKRLRQRIIIAACIWLVGIILEHAFSVRENVELIVFFSAYMIVGNDILRKVTRNIRGGLIFDENFLMSVASLGAFFVGDYSEAVLVMLLYQIGELFQSYAVNRSRKSIAELMDIRPDYANVRRDGELVQVDPAEVAVGEMITVKPGERIPLDGVVKSGTSSLDTKQLTGEAMPRDIETGEAVISGCININGVLEVEVSKVFGESTVSKILDLVENSGNVKARTEKFITRFARYYTPAVVLLAVLLAVIPPVFMGGQIDIWVYRALTFLVVSCPCALVISVPLSFFGGIGGASKMGILVKGSNYLEALVDAEIVVMDKTGTLTKGNFKVTEIHEEGIGKEELLKLTAYAESYSNHPISNSLREAYGKEIEQNLIRETEEIAGHGVKAVVDGRVVYAGNSRLMRKTGVSFTEVKLPGTVVYVCVDDKYKGYILISDQIKEDAKEAVSEMKKAGVKKLVMLTGDNKITGESIAGELGIDEVHTDLLPGDKVDRMQELMKEKSAAGRLIFVGDGINDAPVLAGADVGIAMGGLGSDAAIEAADIVIMTDEPSKIPKALALAKKTVRIVKQNIVFALGVKILVLALAAVGMASMGAAIFADVGVAILAICNAVRTLKVKG